MTKQEAIKQVQRMANERGSHRKGLRAFDAPSFLKDPTVQLLKGLPEEQLKALIRLAGLELARRRNRPQPVEPFREGEQ